MLTNTNGCSYKHSATHLEERLGTDAKLKAKYNVRDMGDAIQMLDHVRRLTGLSKYANNKL